MRSIFTFNKKKKMSKHGNRTVHVSRRKNKIKGLYFKHFLYFGIFSITIIRKLVFIYIQFIAKPLIA